MSILEALDQARKLQQFLSTCMLGQTGEPHQERLDKLLNRAAACAEETVEVLDEAVHEAANWEEADTLWGRVTLGEGRDRHCGRSNCQAAWHGILNELAAQAELARGGN